jgi:hypothetical protein
LGSYQKAGAVKRGLPLLARILGADGYGVVALAVGIAFPLLDLAGFDAGGANGSGPLLALALLYGGLPVVLKLMAVPLLRGLDTTLPNPAHPAGDDHATIPAPLVPDAGRRPADRLQQHEA